MRYIVGVIAVVLIMFFGIIWAVNRGGDNGGDESVDLSQYVDRDGRVVFTHYGKVVGQQERRAVRVTVTREERVIEVLQGYDEQVIRTQTYPNIDAAYAEFIMSLHRAGYANEKEAEEDPSGFCPLGNRYTYELDDGNEAEVLNLWSTSCSGREGTFAGDPPTVRRLFQLQIPNYNDLTRDVRL